MQKFEPGARAKRKRMWGHQRHDNQLESAVYSYVAGGGLVLPFHESCASPGGYRVFPKEESPKWGCEGRILARLVLHERYRRSSRFRGSREMVPPGRCTRFGRRGIWIGLSVRTR